MAVDAGPRTRSLFQFLRCDAMPRSSYRGRPRRFAAGDVLIREGARDRVVHLIVTGRVGIQRRDPTSGDLVRICEAGVDDTIGESGIFSGRAREMTVTALSDVMTISMSHEQILAAMLELPGVPEALRRMIEPRLAADAVEALA